MHIKLGDGIKDKVQSISKDFLRNKALAGLEHQKDNKTTKGKEILQDFLLKGYDFNEQTRVREEFNKYFPDAKIEVTPSSYEEGTYFTISTSDFVNCSQYSRRERRKTIIYQLIIILILVLLFGFFVWKARTMPKSLILPNKPSPSPQSQPPLTTNQFPNFNK